MSKFVYALPARILQASNCVPCLWLQRTHSATGVGCNAGCPHASLFLSEIVLAKQAKEKDSAARIKRFMTIMDSRTDKELDSSDIKLWQTESRIMRIARGAGVHPQYVDELIGWP